MSDYVTCKLCDRPPLMCKCKETEQQNVSRALRSCYRAGYTAAASKQPRECPYIDVKNNAFKDEWLRGFDAWTLRYKPAVSTVQ